MIRKVFGTFSVFAMCFALQTQQVAADTFIAVQSQHFSGTRNTEEGGGVGTDGVDGEGGWSGNGNNGFEIKWNITENANATPGLFSYEYIISGENGSNLSKSLSHWILALSPTIDWGPAGENVDFGGDNEVKTPATNGQSYGPGGSNPGIPGDIPGVKWEIADNGGSPSTFSFLTFQIPVWGSFYAKDGKDNGSDTYAFNEGFATYSVAFPTVEDGFVPDGSFDVIPWIAVPDTLTVANIIPEPSSFSLLAIGGLCVGFVAFRRKRKLKITAQA